MIFRCCLDINFHQIFSQIPLSQCPLKAIEKMATVRPLKKICRLCSDMRSSIREPFLRSRRHTRSRRHRIEMKAQDWDEGIRIEMKASDRDEDAWSWFTDGRWLILDFVCKRQSSFKQEPEWNSMNANIERFESQKISCQECTLKCTLKIPSILSSRTLCRYLVRFSWKRLEPLIGTNVNNGNTIIECSAFR